LIIHCSVIVLSSIMTIVCYFNKSLGKSLFGTCSTEAVSSLPLSGPLIALLFILVGLGSIIYFKKRLPDIESMGEIKQDFISQFYFYIKCCIFIYSLIAFFNFFAFSVCSMPEKLDSSNYNWLIPSNNICKMLNPFILTWVRLRNKFISGKIDILKDRLKKKIFRKLRR
jgi:hypothetical protein